MGTIHDFLDPLRHKYLHSVGGTAVSVRAEDILAGQVGTGVNIPAANIQAGNLAAGVKIRAQDVLAGTFIAGVLIPSAGVQSGTLTGPFTVTGTTTFTGRGRFADGGNRTYFWEGLEIGHPAATPYIDFHRSSNPEEAADYNIRLINNANDVLHMYSAAGGAWGQFKIGDGLQMGAYGWDSGWAHFGHQNDFSGSAAYAFMSHHAGDTIVSARGTTFIRAQNAGERMKFDNACHTFVRLNVSGGVLVHSDWLRVRHSEGLYFEDRGHGWNSGANGIINNYAEGKLRLHKNAWMSSGGWGSAPESESAGNQDVGWSWHMPGWRAAIMWLGTDNIFRLQNDNGAWPRFDVDVNDVSGIATKRDIQDITEPVLPKLRKLKPIRYKRKTYDQKAYDRWEKEVREGRWAEEAVAQRRRAEEEVHAGFTAENMAEVFPEVATLNPNTGEYDGIRYREMVAPLTKAIVELEDQILALRAEVVKSKEKK